MSDAATPKSPSRLGGGIWGPILLVSLGLCVVALVGGRYLWPHYSRDHGHGVAFDDGMFGSKIEQPIAFSHRLHVTNKEIDCFYCHSYAERSLNAGLPSADKCLACHDRIIPHHEEIEKLRAYRDSGTAVPWIRVYYNPDHVYFPHYRHIDADVKCQQCHGEVERVDRLNKVTFYMGMCVDCHEQRGASLDCAACHQ